VSAPVAAPATRFELPPGLEADEPPEARGLRRDDVRLLVATPDGTSHARFAALGRFLRPGDLLVVNTSATLPAALDGRRPDGQRVVVHVAGRERDGWVVELRTSPGADRPVLDAVVGERLELAHGAALVLRAPAAAAVAAGRWRLWRVEVLVEGGLRAFLGREGRPVRYGYVPRPWPLAAYQTVFAGEPGSAEMPSAGRPFTAELVTSLVSSGVAVAPVLLHTGLSSPERSERPRPEWFRVPAATARLAAATRRSGGRVVAVGTTVVRALASVDGRDGVAERGAEGWTDVVVEPGGPRPPVDGLVTGWHAPEASHLLLLEAVAGTALVQRAYDEALAQAYRWHEFGDSCLLLPRG
jgi:S-adenosylmethionine:tRNA ribosyltransferase-isomerase